jgi:hypothetical protein
MHNLYIMADHYGGFPGLMSKYVEMLVTAIVTNNAMNTTRSADVKHQNNG